jgi:LuxR family maltose regulon positive regulatory protein
MAIPLLNTKLYVPASRPHLVPRVRLIELLNHGLRRKLTLISAPAGFGKTTLVSEWLASLQCPIAWLSLDDGDNDLQRFLTYFVTTMQTIAPDIGQSALGVLHSQPPLIETSLTLLLNDISAVPTPFVLVLDDYHVIGSKSVDYALTFLVDRLPPQAHVVISTREDPQLPLARLRARDQLTELRAADLRFTPSEATAFLADAMGLVLSAEHVSALEARTEGWVAGLQLAAISLQGHHDVNGFIASFTGSHRFVMDYLVEEVLRQQPEDVQMFLLRTSILDRLCGPLCDAVTSDATASGQATLERLARANLFITPLDDERRWYRYHQLFAELLQQRLQSSIAPSTDDERNRLAALHLRASVWHEEHGMELEAFQHAVAGHDVERAARLIDDTRMLRHAPGVATTILDWLASLPKTTIDAMPSLWVRYASLLLTTGQVAGVEQKLLAAEKVLQGATADHGTQDLLGQIAAMRATMALAQYKGHAILAQSMIALEQLSPENLSLRAGATWTLGVAYILQGDRAAARRAYSDAIALSQLSENTFTTMLATIGLGNIQEMDNQLHRAKQTYQHVLTLAGDTPLPIGSEAHLPLARICYEWNDLEAAEFHGYQSLHLAGQYGRGIDRFVLCEVFLARLKLAKGDVEGAASLLAQAAYSAGEQNFTDRLPEIAAMQALIFLRQGNLEPAVALAHRHYLPLIQARVYLAQNDPGAALATLDPWQRQVEANAWEDEKLKVALLQALALLQIGAKDRATQTIVKALTLAEPGGFIRSFIDEGPPMARLLSAAASQEIMPDYIGKLLTAFDAEQRWNEETSRHASGAPAYALVEPLSQRELEVLRLIAQGCSNYEISERLFIALDTVKGHNRKIFGKLQVRRRTEAVSRASALGLL